MSTSEMNIVPRMVDQKQHFDVCSVVNHQSGSMILQVKEGRHVDLEPGYRTSCFR